MIAPVHRRSAFLVGTLGACVFGASLGACAAQSPAAEPAASQADGAAHETFHVATPVGAPGQADVGELWSEGEPPFTLEAVAEFDDPWAMAFLPSGEAALITTKPGGLYLWRPDAAGPPMLVSGVPTVLHRRQGGLGDIALSPNFAADQVCYLSYVEADDGGSRAVLAKARLDLSDPDAPALVELRTIWRQSEASRQALHFAYRIVFSPDGSHLFLTSGERNDKDPAQDVTSNLGKVLRLTLDGAPAAGNPFAGQGGAADEVWSLGHRNPLGLAFDRHGRLWEHEMGPRGGDEFNLIEPGANYGWPLVSNGDHYSGADIPDHPTRPDLRAPALYWAPSMSPATLVILDEGPFAAWRDHALIGALSGQSVLLAALPEPGETDVQLVARWRLDWRVRELEQAPDGSLWMLEDAAPGRLFRMTPRP